MRDDLQYLFINRKGKPKAKYIRVKPINYDIAPNKEAMVQPARCINKFGWHCSNGFENYLRGCNGKPWDEVYSHLKKTALKNAQLSHLYRYIIAGLKNKGYTTSQFIDEQGILRPWTPPKRQKREVQLVDFAYHHGVPKKIYIYIPGELEFHVKGGIWFAKVFRDPLFQLDTKTLRSYGLKNNVQPST